MVGFQSYGGLASSLRELLGATPEVDFEEYQQRSRVQVGSNMRLDRLGATVVNVCGTYLPRAHLLHVLSLQ